MRSGCDPWVPRPTAATRQTAGGVFRRRSISSGAARTTTPVTLSPARQPNGNRYGDRAKTAQSHRPSPAGTRGRFPQRGFPLRTCASGMRSGVFLSGPETTVNELGRPRHAARDTLFATRAQAVIARAARRPATRGDTGIRLHHIATRHVDPASPAPTPSGVTVAPPTPPAGRLASRSEWRGN